jgi:hypothetical protein
VITFENYDRKIDKIQSVLSQYGIKDLEDALAICVEEGFNPYELVTPVGHIQQEQLLL